MPKSSEYSSFKGLKMKLIVQKLEVATELN